MGKHASRDKQLLSKIAIIDSAAIEQMTAGLNIPGAVETYLTANPPTGGLTINQIKSDTDIASAISSKHSNSNDHSNSLDHSSSLDHSNSLDHAAGSDNQVIPDQLSDLSEDVTHRTVTDTEKSTWNGKGSSNLVIGDLAANAYYGDKGKTAYDHSQVSHAPAGAEINVNADWNSGSGDSQIMNKPSIPAAQVQTDWSSVSGMGQLLNKPTISGSNTGDNSANTLYSGLATSKENTGVAASAITTHAALKTGVHGMLANVIVFGQGNPSAKTAAVTLTIAELLTGIVTGNPAAAAAYTLPTGTLCEGGLTIGVNEAFDWVLSNIATTATFIITLTAGTGHTIVGCAKIPSNSATTGGLWGTAAAMFRTRKTATNTFVTYRIG